MTMFLFYFNFDNKQIITPQHIQISKQKILSNHCRQIYLTDKYNNPTSSLITYFQIPSFFCIFALRLLIVHYHL